MAKVTFTLPDGSKKEYDSGVSGLDVAKSIGQRLAQATIAVKLNGTLMDAFVPIHESGTFQILTFDTPEGKDIFRHSTAHLLAYAIK